MQSKILADLCKQVGLNLDLFSRFTSQSNNVSIFLKCDNFKKQYKFSF